MSASPPGLYPGCTWADRPRRDPHGEPIGTAANIDPETGLTNRYRVIAWDPHARTVRISLDVKEDRSGAVRPFPPERRAQVLTAALHDLDDVRLTHRRDRDDTAAFATPSCRHQVKAAFTAGGDRGVPAARRVYKFWMQDTDGDTRRFLVKAPSQRDAHDFARRWWSGRPTADGWSGKRLPPGVFIEALACEGAREYETWPHPDPIADPA
ncbi:hypothetical protein AB0F20_10290 [Streptomyces goshikiensis]|uniref:hypothetical protein n=1 Tax=Streptomyces goshikiensis TaxID=1942 RepID=UPI0033D03068